jgi:hypothetical protein
MRNHYDFSKGVRGKYARRFRNLARTVVLDPDVAAIYRDSRAVNRALRRLIAAGATKRAKPRAKAPPRRRSR